MQYSFLDSSVKRTVTTCNYNQHIRAAHPDRTMDVHDLIYIREGHWTITQEGMDYEVAPGDVVMLHGGCHHYGPKPCEETVKTCFVHFNMLCRDKLEKEKGSDPSFWAFPTVVNCENNPMVLHCFERIIYAYWSESESEKKKASAYLDLLLCEIACAAEQEYRPHSMVEDIKLVIKNTPNRFFSVRELAQKHHCSEKTVSSKFKEGTGESLHAWQLRLKCQMAEELIRFDPSLTLKEIAATYGFYDEYHFGKCFKKVTGHSPKRLR